jgi:hypothetical protein
MKKVVLPISTFAVGFLIAFIVFKLSYKDFAHEDIKPNIIDHGSQVQVSGNPINILPQEKKGILSSISGFLSEVGKPDTGISKSQVQIYKDQEQAYKNYLTNLPPEKRELIASLTPMDEHVWREVRREKEYEVVRNGDVVWANGWDGEKIIQERFDEDIAEQFTGEYRGTYSFKNKFTNQVEKYNLAVVFKGTKNNDNSLIASGKNGVSYTHTGSIDNLGMDVNNLQLIITWGNPPDPFYYISNLAFKLPLIKPGETGKYMLYGLDDQFEWQEIGEVELKKIK